MAACCLWDISDGKAQGTPVKTTLKIWEIMHSNRLKHEAAVAAAASPVKAEGELRSVSFHALCQKVHLPLSWWPSVLAGQVTGVFWSHFIVTAVKESWAVLLALCNLPRDCSFLVLDYGGENPDAKPSTQTWYSSSALKNHQSFHLGLCDPLSSSTTGPRRGWTDWFVQFRGRTEIIRQQGKSKWHHCSETGYAATVSLVGFRVEKDIMFCPALVSMYLLQSRKNTIFVETLLNKHWEILGNIF